MVIALCFTLVRILLSPLFLIIYLYHQDLGISLILLPYILILIQGISELSDLFDGFFARRKNEVTELGKLLDPMADSIFRLSVFLTFTQGIVQLPLILVLFFFYRDSIISTLRTLCALRGVALGARLSGKIKAVLQASVTLLILILMIFYSLGHIDLHLFQKISMISVLIVCLYTISSGIEYIYANRSYIQKALNRK
ncbi:MAG: CDP-alcohol phosphatidyltransferase family protein [Chlamydiales bacterium]|nr:CDP-alcohol phosphatidyltransferase family protein [Chlamydiales bacterium]